MNKTHTREHWLAHSIYLLANDLLSMVEVPLNLVVVHGLPDFYSERDRDRTAGCCDDRGAKPKIYISPSLDDPVELLGTIVHELIHVSIGCWHYHDEVFEKPAREIGLSGDLDHTVPGPELSIRLAEISDKLGTYPKN